MPRKKGAIMYSENLDTELESMESLGETEAEWTDQETELLDAEGDEDELMGPDAEESDLEHAYASFSTPNENDYDGWDPSEVEEEADLQHSSNVLESKPDAFHLEDTHDLEEQVIDMEVEDGDIQGFLVDENGVEVGFVLLDEQGKPREYYYVDDPDGTTIDAEGTASARAIRQDDGEEFDLDMTREEVSEGAPFADRIQAGDL